MRHVVCNMPQGLHRANTKFNVGEQTSMGAARGGPTMVLAESHGPLIVSHIEIKRVIQLHDTTTFIYIYIYTYIRDEYRFMMHVCTYEMRYRRRCSRYRHE